ncbi:MAG: 50S ribosomal protein L15 [Candidatus Omnitrophica bacterium]|nr:50S ribosomal protein L15 [Candidatus Omnitrophota bacterium]
MKLSKMSVPKGATHRTKRRGCGRSSGHGKTSCRGQKGQRARSGHGIRPWLEGGQMPLVKRIPKRGFAHAPNVEYQIVNLNRLEKLAAGTVVDPASLAAQGLIRNAARAVKILGDGKLTHPLIIKAHGFSEKAAEQIKKAGGEAHRLPLAHRAPSAGK